MFYAGPKSHKSRPLCVAKEKHLRSSNLWLSSLEVFLAETCFFVFRLTHFVRFFYKEIRDRHGQIYSSHAYENFVGNLMLFSDNYLKQNITGCEDNIILSLLLFRISHTLE